MRRFGRRLPGVLLGGVLCAAAWGLAGGTAWAAEVVMKDGRVLRGKLGAVTSLADMPQTPTAEGRLQLIILLDDDLRRTFVSKRQIKPVDVRPEETRQLEEKFKVWQKVLRIGPSVKSVGPVIKIEPFDEFGRRTFIFNTPKGPVSIVQGITEITPQWCKVEGISHIWDMRIATSSIPREILHKILLKQIDPKNVEHHKRIARFYLQCERYDEARAQLESILAAFPDKTDVKTQLEPSIRELRQMAAQRLVAELKLRRDAGQHQMAQEKLKTFPAEGVAGEVLQAVREMIEEYKTLDARRSELLQQFDEQLAKVTDTSARKQIESIRKEIGAELDINTLGRMATFRQNLDDQAMKPEEKLALAISGWLLGADEAMGNLAASLSLLKVREIVRQYMTEPIKMNREQMLTYLQSEQAATPAMLAALLANMKPPFEPPEPLDPKKSGYYRLEVPGLPKDGSIPYLVQLPPEYNPYRRYPAVVTLNGAGTTPEQQVDWWAGAWTEAGIRAGQASRQGYIVIAPEWSVPHQKQYNYSAREHAAVLNSLRDACRRFAIDTDRVFLSGHSMGGDAAWDLALAHPDLWAGVIPIVAQADRYCALYWENAKYVPFYVVCGELDGNKLTKNARDLDRYLTRGYNTTVVEYLGRGHEHFYDEILRVFDWMGRFRREFYPREFACSTMRHWDNFFWWVELNGMPSRSVVDPSEWPPPRGAQPVQVKGNLTDNNGIAARTGTTYITVWISPKMVDLKQRVNVVVNGHRVNTGDRFVEPDVRTLLEDVRTRGDRQHPFWAKIETPTGRISTGP